MNSQPTNNGDTKHDDLGMWSLEAASASQADTLRVVHVEPKVKISLAQQQAEDFITEFKNINVEVDAVRAFTAFLVKLSMANSAVIGQQSIVMRRRSSSQVSPPTESAKPAGQHAARTLAYFTGIISGAIDPSAPGLCDANVKLLVVEKLRASLCCDLIHAALGVFQNLIRDEGKYKHNELIDPFFNPFLERLIAACPSSTEFQYLSQALLEAFVNEAGPLCNAMQPTPSNEQATHRWNLFRDNLDTIRRSKTWRPFPSNLADETKYDVPAPTPAGNPTDTDVAGSDETKENLDLSKLTGDQWVTQLIVQETEKAVFATFRAFIQSFNLRTTDDAPKTEAYRKFFTVIDTLHSNPEPALRAGLVYTLLWQSCFTLLVGAIRAAINENLFNSNEITHRHGILWTSESISKANKASDARISLLVFLQEALNGITDADQKPFHLLYQLAIDQFYDRDGLAKKGDELNLGVLSGALNRNRNCLTADVTSTANLVREKLRLVNQIYNARKQSSTQPPTAKPATTPPSSPTAKGNSYDNLKNATSGYTGLGGSTPDKIAAAVQHASSQEKIDPHTKHHNHARGRHQEP